MMKTMLPIGSGLFVKLMFRDARKYGKACKQTREDIDRRVRANLAAWRNAK